MGKNEDTAFYVKELQSEECFCGRRKKPGRSFCYKCFSSLPKFYQDDLYQRMGEGYEDAYGAAANWLDDHDR